MNDDGIPSTSPDVDQLYSCPSEGATIAELVQRPAKQICWFNLEMRRHMVFDEDLPWFDNHGAHAHTGSAFAPLYNLSREKVRSADVHFNHLHHKSHNRHVDILNSYLSFQIPYWHECHITP
uniref:Uncharacterized protein n=1 Tax=Craspedostauros australis TaxID=1486917 RepID=A0A7R9ZQA1_9STRA|mmetsp:Transcript_4739/g.12425  ORF Transcript_4739/g.12425 Transcript_4739/m.12425 type:complete len:122 (+) Transcript_4739:760-1125(+)